MDEIILATSPTLEGESTANWPAAALRASGVRITRIAAGVPAGSDIEYADEVTVGRAKEALFQVTANRFRGSAPATASTTMAGSIGWR